MQTLPLSFLLSLSLCETLSRGRIDFLIEPPEEHGLYAESLGSHHRAVNNRRIAHWRDKNTSLVLVLQCDKNHATKGIGAVGPAALVLSNS